LVLEAQGSWTRVRVADSARAEAAPALFLPVTGAGEVKSPLGAWSNQIWISLGEGAMCEPASDADVAARSCPVDEKLRKTVGAAKLVTIVPTDAVKRVALGGERVYERGAPIGCFVIGVERRPELAIDLDGEQAGRHAMRMPTGAKVTLTIEGEEIGKVECPDDREPTLSVLAKAPRGTTEISGVNGTAKLWSRSSKREVQPWLCGARGSTRLKFTTDAPGPKTHVVDYDHELRQVVLRPNGTRLELATFETWAPKTKQQGGCTYQDEICVHKAGWVTVPQCDANHAAEGAWVDACGPAPTCKPLLDKNRKVACVKMPP
jgi:hypothetical protein